MRLNKALAAAGVCSRRQADELIRQGLVSVNGAAVRDLGLRVEAGDVLSVRGQPVSRPAPDSGHTYIMLHKPIQVVSTAKDPEGRRTVLDLLPANLRAKRLYPAGRLDYFSEGLILLTDDGELTKRLTHPSHHLPKYYEVQVREPVTQDMLQTLRQGMRLAEGERLAPVEAALLPAGQPHTMRLILHQGLNRQIRRMCRDLGLTILRLRRIAQGPLELGGLPTGQCRPLTSREVADLKKAVGL